MTYKHNKKLLTKIAKTKHKINMLNMLKNSLVEDNDMEQLINCEGPRKVSRKIARAARK